MQLHTSKASPGLSHEERLDRLAELAIRVGLGLAEGQELVMTAPLDALPLARRITEHAYKAGASLVTILYTDEQAALMRFRHAPDASFDRAPRLAVRGDGGRLSRGRGAACGRGRGPLAAGGRGLRKGRAR